MKFIIKKIYFVILLTAISLFYTSVFAKNSQIKYSRENISNYFSGIISSKQDSNDKTLRHLKKVKSLKNKHSKFNTEFLRTLVLLNKFNEAFKFSESVWKEDEYFFEADLILGLNAFTNNDYFTARKYFKRLNNLSEYNLIFQDFVGNTALAWVSASENKKEESFELLNKIPKRYNHLIKIQNSFLECYFNTDKAALSYDNLINEKDYNFSRYNFFFTNYLLHKNNTLEAKKIINKSRESNESNLLLKQTQNFILENKSEKIKYFFNCKNPNDALAEFFYIIANLYASEKYYKLSNYYLNISLFLNQKFSTNKALLAENYYYQKKYKLSEQIYNSLKSIGSEYSWYAAKSIASIFLTTKGTERSIEILEKEFNLLAEPNFEHYYEMANFYKDNEYFLKSVEYYSLALENLEKNHFLIPKILDRRGTSYERLGDWERAEKDLNESLKILPDQPHVLNYLAYSWIDQGIHLDKVLDMLKKANKLKQNNGYIVS